MYMCSYSAVYSETSDKEHSNPKEGKPPNKGQTESTLAYILYRKSPLNENNLSTEDKTAGPKGVLIKRFNCTGMHVYMRQVDETGPREYAC